MQVLTILFFQTKLAKTLCMQRQMVLKESEEDPKYTGPLKTCTGA